jgi:predicted lipid-binding transport protein (Tim44 family)
MGDGFQIFDILLFAAIAGFLLLRLRSVLGRRSGNEQRRPDPFNPSQTPAGPQDKVVPLPRARPAEGIAPPAAPATAPAVSGVAALRAASPGFDEAEFLSGARGAFEIIVNAFAAGDTAALRPLLSNEVYEGFAEAIRTRIAAKETHETTLMSIKSADIAEAAVEDGAAVVTVKFVSDQVNVTRAENGAVVEGDPDRIVEQTDYWTFSRPIRARDPNWTLIATHSP